MKVDERVKSNRVIKEQAKETSRGSIRRGEEHAAEDGRASDDASKVFPPTMRGGVAFPGTFGPEK